ncbi:MAG: anaerobic ribonucleoside-triphosphate reductase activating protein [Lachnospiraceae bacterium]|jgi:anaerobic ribonucleoside-triphosphate reductase activating protein|nr:anaerobic ribonucleoside-triphosphate reductase activating protein [Lachnospiraceae bacterium]
MRYHNITKDDMKNGDGLRVVLWVAGCNHCCKGCQNPITWDPDGGLPFDEAAEAEIYEQLDKPYIAGITFSGGDPLHPANRVAVRELAAKIKEKYPNKTIWLYTGDSWENIYHYPVMKYVDVLVDGEFQIDKLDVTLMWKGSSNQRVIDVQKSLLLTDPSTPLLHCGDYYGNPVVSTPVTSGDYNGTSCTF